jgi:hypothetical protein
VKRRSGRVEPEPEEAVSQLGGEERQDSVLQTMTQSTRLNVAAGVRKLSQGHMERRIISSPVDL